MEQLESDVQLQKANVRNEEERVKMEKVRSRVKLSMQMWSEWILTFTQLGEGAP